MTGGGLGMTKGDDPFSVRAQHDVPREITRFPKGHVKPCPYGTFETSLVMLPANGHQAVPLRDNRGLAGDAPGQRSSCRAAARAVYQNAKSLRSIGQKHLQLLPFLYCHQTFFL